MKWEYKVAPVTMKVQMERLIAYREGRKPLMDSIQDALNVLGEDSWELVAIETLRFNNSHHTFAYLKRQKTEA